MILYVKNHDASVPVVGAGVVIAHIVNNRGDWGGGFTASLSPESYATYREMIDNPSEYRLGSMQLEPIGDKDYLCHMMAQDNLTPNRAVRVDYDALDRCLLRLDIALDTLQLPVQMPRIGTGIGGGSWTIIEELIRRRLHNRFVYVCDYEPRKREP